MGQWAFIFTPGHPALRSVLEQVKFKFETFENPDDLPDDFVHAITGPGVFTEGIAKYLLGNKEESNSPTTLSGKNVFDMYHAGTFDKQRLQEITILNETAFHFDYLKHNYGSQRWKDSGSYKVGLLKEKNVLK